MQNSTVKARQAFKWTLYLRGLSQLMTWLISLIVIRFLTPADYGIVALAETVLTFVMLLCSSGLGDALIQEKNADETFIRKILTLLLLLTTVISASLFLGASWVADYYRLPELLAVLRLSSLVFLVTPWMVVSSSLLAMKMDFKSRGLIDLAAAVATSLMSLAMAYQGCGFWSLIIASLANLFLRTVGYCYILRTVYLPVSDLSHLWRPFKFGMTVAATSLVFGLFMKVDILVAADAIDPATLGYYALSMHLALLPMVKLMPLVNEVAYPMYATIKDNLAECQRIFAYILRLISFFAFPLFFIFAAVAEELVTLVLGEKWFPAVAALQIILTTIPFRIITNLFSPLLRAMGYPSTGLQHVSFSLIVVAAAVYLMAPYGLTGLAFAWVFTTPPMLAFALFLTTRRSGVAARVVLAAVALPALLSMVVLILLKLMQQSWFQNWPPLLNIVISSVLGGFVYVILSWYFNREHLLEALKFRL